MVIAKAHSAAEALLIQISQSTLVVVMIGRSQQCAAESIARDVREISLERLRLGYVDPVEIRLGKTKRAALEKMAIGRNGAVFAKLKKRNARRDAQLHIVPRRFFEKQAREREE